MTRPAEPLRSTTVIVEWWSAAHESKPTQAAGVGGRRISRGVQFTLLRAGNQGPIPFDTQLPGHRAHPHPRRLSSAPSSRIRFVLGSAFGICVTLLIQLLLY